jgi:hypothetical protein
MWFYVTNQLIGDGDEKIVMKNNIDKHETVFYIG